ncbi:MAG: FG-GAP repeat domain-containing protein, partial [Limisphaerales bacterium]
MKLVRLILFGTGFLVFLFAATAAIAQQLFDSWITYSIDKQPRSVQSADMDADGDLDLIIGHFQGRGGLATVIVMENDGAGFFALGHTLYPTTGGVVSVEVFDLDGDGDLDVLSASPATGKLNLFRSKGPGNGFELPLECRAGPGTSEVTAGFLDADGFPEVLAVNQSEGTLSIYKNRGSAAYPAESVKVVGVRPRSMQLFDMDNDGDNDIAASVGVIRGNSPSDPYVGFNGFVLFDNQGNGAIDDSSRVLYKIANPSAPTLLDTALNPLKILTADFNNDGFKDLALVGSASTATQPGRNVVCVFLNRQDGTFAANPALSLPGRYTVVFGAASITAADVDADGDQDIVSANQNDGTVSVLKNNGNGTFAAKTDFLTPNNPPSVVSGGDYDGDGDYDLAIVSLNGASFAVMRNIGNGSFEVGTEFSTSSASEPVGIACGDLDGDGDNDLAAALFNRPQISVHLNTGAGSFPATPPLYITGGGPIAITMANLDGDSDLDLAVANRGSSDLSVLLNNGNGTFALAVNYSTGSGSFPVDISAGDLDGDADIDLATANSGTST